MRVLITGAGGMLARALEAEGLAAGHDVVALPRAQLDVTDADAVARAVALARPAAVLHCAAYTHVDDAERNAAEALVVNATGALNVARACAAHGARFLYPGTDYVFDGRAQRPYSPDSPTAPAGAYARSKLAGEAATAAAGDYLIVRTAWLYGAGGRNFVSTILERARAGAQLRVVDDQRGSPTWTGDLARILLRLLERDAPAGTYHATNSGEATWCELARAATEIAGIDAHITPVTTAEVPRPAPRPAYSVLDCSGTAAIVGAIPHWRDALERALAAGGL